MINLRAVFSGVNNKQNNLTANNVTRLLNKVRSRQDFIECWIYSCVLTIDVLLDMLMFQNSKNCKGKKENGVNSNTFKTFRNNIGKLNEQKTFEIFKILGKHFLIIFLKNKDNIIFLESTKLRKEDFENEVIKIFDFTEQDKEDYKKLDEKFSTNTAGYFCDLYDEIFSKGFGLFPDEDLVAYVVFSRLLGNLYENCFLDILRNKIKNDI